MVVETHLAALHELLLGRRVLVGGGGVLRGSDGLSGSRCRLFGCILTNRYDIYIYYKTTYIAAISTFSYLKNGLFNSHLNHF